MSEEQKRKIAFDLARAGFYLVAAVIGTHLFIALLGALTCIYATLIVPPGANTLSQCDNTSQNLSELLAAALAAALAFAGGRSVPKE